MKSRSEGLEETLAQLKALGDEKGRARNAQHGAGDKQFGVPLGEIRKLAKRIKTNHALATALWETGNMDARLLAILLIEPKKLSADELDRMVRSGSPAQVADWLNTYVVKNHPDKETLRQSWMEEDDPWAARAGWSLTSERIGKSPGGLDLPGLLDRIESEMGDAAPEVQWTMNFCLAGIGIHFPKHRSRAIAIGESLGVYRDYPVSKGCTSPFAPIWIREMVGRGNAGTSDAGTGEQSDWRGEMLSRLRKLIREADPEVVEEVKWRKPSNPAGVPVWSHDGILCTGETYKDKVKLTFARGAALADPSGLFNASLDGNTRRAIDFQKGDTINEKALKALIRAAAALNTSAQARPVRGHRGSE